MVTDNKSGLGGKAKALRHRAEKITKFGLAVARLKAQKHEAQDFVAGPVFDRPQTVTTQ